MLQPKLKIDPKPADGKLITVKDDTGVYSESNPGGYGAPNETRGNLYGDLLAELHSDDEVTPIEVEVVPEDATPLNVASWNISLHRDGYYRLLFILAPLYNPALNYQTDDVRYYQGDFYKAKNNPDTGDSITNSEFWDKIEKPSDYPLLSQNAGVYFGLLDYLHTVYSEKCVPQKTVDFVTNGEYESVSDLKQEILRNATLKASVYKAGWGDFNKAGYLMDNLVELCSQKSCANG